MNRIVRTLSFWLIWFVLTPFLLWQQPKTVSAVLSESLQAYSASSSLVPVMVELKSPGLLDNPLFQTTGYFSRQEDSKSDSDIKAMRQALIQSQQDWIAVLQSKPISFFYRSSCQYVGNIINLYVKGTDLNRLASDPSVLSVLLDWQEKPLRKIMSASTGAYRMWNGSAGAGKATGKGIKIGIIDSGIDYNHPEFEKKIVKGIDFTSDGNYKDDGIGHGTHVAGIAAGLGSNENGKGMAYDGSLYVYKVFPRVGGGCSGSDVIQALEMAVADKLDVVNLSLGHLSDGRSKEGNVYYSIIQKVVKANVFVVAAIGNSGARGKEVPWPAGTPGVVEEAFCVAASNDRKFSSTLHSEDQSFPYTPLNKSAADEALQINSHELVDAGYGSVEELSDSSLSGKILVIARGPASNPLSFSEKIQNALHCQPKGILFTAPSLLKNEAIPCLESFIESIGVKIPVIMMQQDDALAILRKTHSPVPTQYYADKGITIADFSSMGPSSDSIFKPDISAPGVDIIAPFLKKYGGYAALSGTSMATPSVTGLVALIKELKPSWTINQIKSALMNNADIMMNPICQEPITYTLQGAGQARVDKAIQTEAFLNPRAFIIENKETFTQEIYIQNALSTELSISSIKTEVFGLTNPEAIQIEISSKPIRLKAKESTRFSVQFTIRKQLFRRSRYEGNIWINQMHIPFVIYKDTIEIENRNAIKNPISDLLFERSDLVNTDEEAVNRIEFAFNTGTEQKFEGEIQYSNFGTIRMYLCDKQGEEWITKPIIEFKQCPVGCYAYDWEYQEFIRDNFIPNGTYRLKVTTSANQSIELMSDPLIISDSPTPTFGTFFLGIPKNQLPETQVYFQLSAIQHEKIDEIEYTFNYDDSRLSIESVDLDPAIIVKEPPVIKSSSVKITIPAINLPLNERFYIGRIKARTSKKVGRTVLSNKILVKIPGNKQKARIHGYLPELTITKKIELNGDVNQDDVTDLADFFLLTKKMGLDYLHPEYDPSCDLNQDKIIDMLDYEVWLQEFSV